MVLYRLIFVGAASLPTMTVSLLQNSGNEYIAPSSILERSPCPAINTLANHGFINRNGSDILVMDLASAAEHVFGFAREDITGIFVLETTQGPLPHRFDADDNLIINLHDLYTLDHDASFVRQNPSAEDPEPQFDEDLYSEFEALADEGIFTVNTIDTHRHIRITDSRRNNQPNLPVLPIISENLFVLLFGTNSDLTTGVSSEYMKSFLGPNQIPDGFTSRKERNDTILTLSEPPVSDILAHFNTSVQVAVNSPLSLASRSLPSEHCISGILIAVATVVLMLS